MLIKKYFKNILFIFLITFFLINKTLAKNEYYKCPEKINNVIYEIKNSDNGNTKDVVLYMQKSIASIKSLKK